jgi:hypothetical protein
MKTFGLAIVITCAILLWREHDDQFAQNLDKFVESLETLVDN